MSIDPVRDVAAEGMSHHAFPVIFIYAILFAEGGERVSAVMGRVPFDAEFFEGGIHVGPECADIANQTTLDF